MNRDREHIAANVDVAVKNIITQVLLSRGLSPKDAEDKVATLMSDAKVVANRQYALHIAVTGNVEEAYEGVFADVSDWASRLEIA